MKLEMAIRVQQVKNWMHDIVTCFEAISSNSPSERERERERDRRAPRKRFRHIVGDLVAI
jgi:hypothetical protein